MDDSKESLQTISIWSLWAIYKKHLQMVGMEFYRSLGKDSLQKTGLFIEDYRGLFVGDW